MKKRMKQVPYGVTVNIDERCGGGVDGVCGIIINVVVLMKESDGRDGVRAPVWGYTGALVDGYAQREDQCYEGLSGNIAIDLRYPDIQTWAREVRYVSEYHVDLKKVVRLHKTLSRIEKYMTMTTSENTRKESAGQWALRFAKAIGAKVVAIPQFGNHLSYADEHYTYFDVDEFLVEHVNAKMYELIVKKAGEDEAKKQVESGVLVGPKVLAEVA